MPSRAMGNVRQKAIGHTPTNSSQMLGRTRCLPLRSTAAAPRFNDFVATQGIKISNPEEANFGFLLHKFYSSGRHA